MQVERELIPPHILTPPTVFIHSDIQAVLTAIVKLQTTKTGQYLIKQVLDKIERIKQMSRREGIIVQLNWIPGHADIYGNELTDRTANEGRTNVIIIPELTSHLGLHTQKCDAERANATRPP